MASPTNNLFLRLHKWASRQDENFLTESLAVVIEHLLILTPIAGVRLVARLTAEFIAHGPDEASAIEIQTQIDVKKGRPDLEIRTPHCLVWIEVKVESELRAGQLEGYRILLGECGIRETRLLLLTRYPQTFKPGDARPDSVLRWFEVADWLEEELPAIDAANEIAGFLTRQFLSFLEARNMTIAQVGKYMPEGLRALTNLLNMLFEAASACRISVSKRPNWDDIGLYLDGSKYWVGVHYWEPEKLWFGTRTQINIEAARKLGVGEMEEANWVPGGFRWWRGVELESEAIHFFSRSKVSQMQWLEEFLRECLAQARSIETPDQPPTPEVTEEGTPSLS